MSELDLTGKVALVTGTGSGLGRAMALGLAAAGAQVGGVDISNDGLEATVRDAEAQGGGRVLPIVTDVTSIKDCENAVKTAITELGGLHMVVNCAGLGMAAVQDDFTHRRLNYWKTDPDRWQRLIDVNIRGPFLLARAATPHLLKQGWGRIVNVTTSFNTMMRGGNMPYGQSKAAVEASSVAWADDLKDTGVTCNVLIPGGAADTAMIPDDAPYDRSKLNPPSVMVAPICWLLSDASDGVNGQRFLGRLWDPDAPVADAIAASCSPAGWPELGNAAAPGQARRPEPPR